MIRIPFSSGALLLCACGTLRAPETQPPHGSSPPVPRVQVQDAAETERIFRAVTTQVVADLETPWLNPKLAKPDERGWRIRVDLVDTATAMELQRALLGATGGRVATVRDTLIEKLDISGPYIRNDTALVYVHRGQVWCAGGAVFSAGNRNEYLLHRSKGSWLFVHREPGLFYDAAPPPAPGAPPTGIPCIPVNSR